MSDSVGVTRGAVTLQLSHGPETRGWLPYASVAITAFALTSAMVTVTGRIAASDGGSSLKLYHCVLALLGLGLLVRGRIARVRTEMIIYFGATLACSFAAALVFGVQTRPIINAVIVIFTGVAGATLAPIVGARRALGALRLASALYILAVVVKAAMHLPAFITFFANPQGHPIVPTFSVGGANLEATWISLATLFFIGSAWFLPYSMLALVLSLVYASRVGVIIVALALVAALARSVVVSRSAGRAGGSAARVLAVAIALMGLGATATVHYGDGISYVVKRFQSIGDEPGSLGRLTLWSGGLTVFVRHPFGVGQGNAIPALERELGVDVPEDNLHNLYLQHLVETGLLGLAAYLVFGIMAWRRYVAGRYQDPLLAYVLCYMAVSTIQFSGGDPILWFVWGLQSGFASSPHTLVDA